MGILSWSPANSSTKGRLAGETRILSYDGYVIGVGIVIKIYLNGVFVIMIVDKYDKLTSIASSLALLMTGQPSR